MRLKFLAATMTCLMVSAAQADICESADDQATLNRCAQNAYQAADGDLNALYHQIRQRLSDDPDTYRQLRDAQRHWIAFRDAECAFSASLVEGGSIYPMVLDGCLEGLTLQRVDQFRQYLACEEGDMSCPVPAGD